VPTFVLTYRSPIGYTPTPETRAAWLNWFDGIGDQLAELGKPVIARTSVGNVGSGSTQLGGYSLITADDLEAAVAMAKGCPHVDHDGGVEVGELGEVLPLA
jgi:YCII-related domain